MNREILKLALPNILSNISVPLLGSVDTALMGNLSAAHLGAIGIGGMIFNFIYWNFGFLRMGTTGLTAQAFGANDQRQQALILGTSVSLAILIALMLLTSQNGLLFLSQELLNTPSNQTEIVAEYFSIRIWAAPAALGLYVLFGWTFGQQNAWLPLIITTLSNLVNISLSWYLVVRLDYGVVGVAWGTVIAQYVGVLTLLMVLLVRYSAVIKLLDFKGLVDLENYKKMFDVNSDIFLRTLCLTIAFAFFYSRSAADGALTLAVTTVLLQFLNWMSYAVDGFGFAAEALVGKYTGAKNKTGVAIAIKQCMYWGGALAGFFALGYFFFGSNLVGLFTENMDVKTRAMELLPFLVLLPLIGTACYIWDGVFIGLTASKAMRDTMVIALVVYLGAYWILSSFYTIEITLWVALLLFLGARGMLQTYWYSSGRLE